MGIFHVFKIVQVVPNLTERLINHVLEMLNAVST